MASSASVRIVGRPPPVLRGFVTIQRRKVSNGIVYLTAAFFNLSAGNI